MIKARAIMTENVVKISDDTTLEEAAKIMIGKRVRSLLVTRRETPVAIVSENDIIRGSLNKNLGKVTVKGIMDKSFTVVGPEASYSAILKKLREEGIKRFPVVEGSNIIGIITETDIVDATRDFTRFHQIMQEVILAIFGLFTAFFLFFFSPLGKSIFG